MRRASLARPRGHLILAPLLTLALPACASAPAVRLAAGEAPILVGPAVRDNRTPMDPALACLAGRLAAKGGKALVVGVGDVRDYTGKYAVNEGSAITQGGALMVASALGKLGTAIRLAERFDPTIAERELGYADRRQLGDGASHDLPGPGGVQRVPWLPYYGGSLAASDYYIVGGITELNYNIHSGGFELGVSGAGPRNRTYTQSVAVDLRIVDTRSLLVVRTVSLAKQFTGYERGAGIFRFFGSNLFDINLGAKAQEPLQLGIRTALEEGALRLVASVAGIDPGECLGVSSAAAGPRTISGDTKMSNETLTIPKHALNAGLGASGTGGSEVVILFEPGSAELSGAATMQLAKTAEGQRNTLAIIARDSEPPDSATRDALADRRIAAIRRVLGESSAAGSQLRVVWRPDPQANAITRYGAGQQLIARLAIEPSPN